MSGTRPVLAADRLPLESRVADFVRAKAEALIERHVAEIRDELRARVGEVVASIVTTETTDGGREIVIRVRVGAP